MTPLLLPASIRRCSAESRSFLLGPDGPAGAPPGHRLRSGVSIGQGEDGEKKIRLNKISTLSGEPRGFSRCWCLMGAPWSPAQVIAAAVLA